MKFKNLRQIERENVQQISIIDRDKVSSNLESTLNNSNSLAWH